jgi:hypothetical protein
MSKSDIIGVVLFASFGAWWAVVPQSVVDFYAWFHGASWKRSKLTVGRELVIVRVLGLFWIFLVVAVLALSSRR